MPRPAATTLSLIGTLLLATPALAQKPDPVTITLPSQPTISQRYFGGGSAKLTVTGAIQMDLDIPINKEASYGDGEMTWLQYGASGLSEPNVLVTYGTGDLGVIIGGGGKSATAEGVNCTGSVKVSAEKIVGEYRCKDVTSYEPKTGKMGEITLTIVFSADTR